MVFGGTGWPPGGTSARFSPRGHPHPAAGKLRRGGGGAAMRGAGRGSFRAGFLSREPPPRRWREVGAERGSLDSLAVGRVPPDTVCGGSAGRGGGGEGERGWGVRGTGAGEQLVAACAERLARCGGRDDKAERVPWCWVDLTRARPGGGVVVVQGGSPQIWWPIPGGRRRRGAWGGCWCGAAGAPRGGQRSAEAAVPNL